MDDIYIILVDYIYTLSVNKYTMSVGVYTMSVDIYTMSVDIYTMSVGIYRGGSRDSVDGGAQLWSNIFNN